METPRRARREGHERRRSAPRAAQAGCGRSGPADAAAATSPVGFECAAATSRGWSAYRAGGDLECYRRATFNFRLVVS